MFSPVELHLGLARNVSSAYQGRNAVRRLLGEDASEAFVSDAMLATSELVTNALLHSHGVIELSACFDRATGWLRVEVSDSSSDLPQDVARVPHQVGGLGLRVVAELSSAWGSLPTDHGKTVWFELGQSPEVPAGESRS